MKMGNIYAKNVKRKDDMEELPYNNDFAKLLEYLAKMEYSIHFQKDLKIFILDSVGNGKFKIDFSDLYYPESLIEKLKERNLKNEKKEGNPKLLDESTKNS